MTWNPLTGETVRRLKLKHPTQIVTFGFALAIAVVTALLLLPGAAEPGQRTSFIDALFTATSAVCVTGLTVVDTPTHWSLFGELTILVAIQIGGFGIMTLASLLGLLISNRIQLKTRLNTAVETKALGLGNIGRVVRNVAVGMAVTEIVLATVLAVRLHAQYDHSVRDAIYSGIFHAVSAVCNAGFSLYSNNLVDFVTDPFITLPIALGIILGGLGFPALFELRHHWRAPSSWTFHTKVTVIGSAALIVVGTLMFTIFEWTNPSTLGPLSSPESVLAGFFSAISPRTAGFNTVDYGAMYESTIFGTVLLMFIGGGSAGTAGGIKITTFMVLFFAIVAEVRGDTSVNAFGRRIPYDVQRLALSIALLGVALVVTSTMIMLAITDFSLEAALFETTSAFATVGLTTGITSELPDNAQYLLVALMFIGRTGTVTLATALAIRSRRRLYQYPEEHPIVG